MARLRPWSSLAFRLALSYSGLLILTLATVLAVFYVQTVGVLHLRADRQADNHLRRLLEKQAQNGQAALEAEIRGILQDGLNTDTEIVILADAEGHILMGNATTEPVRRLSTLGLRDLHVRRGDEMVLARVAVAELPNGQMLAVGSDLKALHYMESLITRASLTAVLVALVLAVLGARLFRRVVGDRASEIRNTMARVAAGDLSQRIPVEGPDDEFTQLNRDINSMLDRLEQLMEGIRHVSNTIAHNLRTPLTRMLLQLRNAQNAPASEQSATLVSVTQEVEELGVVFEKLLQIAEVESGTSRASFAQVDMRALLVDVADLYAPVVEDGGGSLRADVIGSPVALGDGDLLASAVANLLDNALKYGGRNLGGADDEQAVDIILRAAEVPAQGPGSPRGVEIVVRDHGAGVDPQVLEKMTIRFYRARTDQRGYGLGLSSVQAIVQLHGGRLEFENVHPGLQARIWLPAVPDSSVSD
ncbi:HAMP domain-containing sensor histidine kinase [Ottowia thiooxydans]|uniref:HAMP domain-containing sensor histidine kinase n=1 Tax=Ottowia thiooxydans TaxID=219182 RepID=UPI00040E0760|nr:HAMP domain-containing sensor histidine kinase [Ottowia thiooxydans]